MYVEFGRIKKGHTQCTKFPFLWGLGEGSGKKNQNKKIILSAFL